MRPTRLYQKKPRKSAHKRTPGDRTTASVEFKRAYERLFGSQGAASPVRKIDPVTGEVIAVIPAGSKIV
jgi:hypothetical protein